jgi:hypothetical protein
MYLTYNDLASRIGQGSDSDSDFNFMLLTEKQAACAAMGLSDRYYLSDRGLVALPVGCKVQRGFEVLLCDHVARSDLHKYLSFQLEGQIYIMPVLKLVGELDMIDPLA